MTQLVGKWFVIHPLLRWHTRHCQTWVSIISTIFQDEHDRSNLPATHNFG